MYEKAKQSIKYISTCTPIWSTFEFKTLSKQCKNNWFDGSDWLKFGQVYILVVLEN